MRKFAYSTVQMAWDVLITLLFIRPYVQTASFFSGKLAVFGTIILMIVPTITATLLFVVNNLGKEEKNKRNFILLVFGILVISACLVYYIKPTKLTITLIIVVMATVECIVARIYTKSKMDGKDTPRSILNVLFDFVIAMFTWKYLTATTDVSWIKIIPAWGIIAITIGVVLLSIFLQYAGEKFLKADALIGIGVLGAATVAWILMDQKGYMADNRSMRLVFLMLFSSLLYFGVLYFGERVASDDE